MSMADDEDESTCTDCGERMHWVRGVGWTCRNCDWD